MSDTFKTGDRVIVTDSPHSDTALPNGALGTVTDSVGGYFLWVDTPGHPSPNGSDVWALTADEVSLNTHPAGTGSDG